MKSTRDIRYFFDINYSKPEFTTLPHTATLTRTTDGHESHSMHYTKRKFLQRRAKEISKRSMLQTPYFPCVAPFEACRSTSSTGRSKSATKIYSGIGLGNLHSSSDSDEPVVNACTSTATTPTSGPANDYISQYVSYLSSPHFC